MTSTTMLICRQRWGPPSGQGCVPMLPSRDTLPTPLSAPFTLDDSHSHRAGVAGQGLERQAGGEGPIPSQRQQLTWPSASWIIRMSSFMWDCVAFIASTSSRRSLQRFVV